MKQQNFNNTKQNLSEHDIDQLIALIGYRCRIKTCNRLRSVLKYGVNTIPNYGIFERLMAETIIDKNEHQRVWSYCAGQSYPDEIRTVRNLILGRQG